jgi:hypothetical protein
MVPVMVVIPSGSLSIPLSHFGSGSGQPKSSGYEAGYTTLPASMINC